MQPRAPAFPPPVPCLLPQASPSDVDTLPGALPPRQTLVAVYNPLIGIIRIDHVGSGVTQP
jgi:hypothetical protein